MAQDARMAPRGLFLLGNKRSGSSLLARQAGTSAPANPTAEANIAQTNPTRTISVVPGHANVTWRVSR